MMNMKKLLILLWLLSACVATAAASDIGDILAQSGNASLRRMYNACTMLSRGVADKDVYLVSLAVDSLDIRIKNPGESFRVNKLKAEAVDTTSTVPLSNCFDFRTEFGKKWIETNGVGPFLEKPSVARTTPARNGCCTLTFRLDAKSSAAYDISQRGQCQMFVAYEPGTDVGLSITSTSGDVEPVHTASDYAWFAEWVEPQRTTVTVRIANRSDVPATIIICTN